MIRFVYAAVKKGLHFLTLAYEEKEWGLVGNKAPILDLGFRRLA